MSSSHDTTQGSSDYRKGSVIVKDSQQRTNRTGVNTTTTNPSLGKTRTNISTRRRGSVQVGTGGPHDKSVTYMPIQKKQIRIMDGDVDVTPQPLLQLDPSGYSKHSRVYMGTGSESGFGPVFGASLVTPSDVPSSQHNNTLQQQSSAGFVSKPVWASGEDSFRSSKDSVNEDFSEVGAAEPAAVGLADVVTKHQEEIEQLTAADLEKNVEIVLQETETMWLLDLPGKCVEAGTPQAEAVKEENEKYKKLIKDRVGNDLYADRGMQTFDNGRKMKHAQTTKISVEDKISMATTWDMYDTYMGLAPVEEEKVEDEAVIEAGRSRPDSPAAEDDKSIAGSEMSKASAAQKSGFVETKTINNVSIIRSVQDSVATATNEGTNEVMDSIFAGSSFGNAASLTESTSQNDINELKNLSNSETFQKILFIMERVVVQNIYQPKLAIYRGLPVYQDIDIYLGEITDDSTSINYQRATSSAPHASQSREGVRTAGSASAVSSGPHLEKLWSFFCDLTKDYTVLCMTWNKQNPDILAVGYGQATYRGQSKGIVCCWSIKNIEYPERVFHLESGITAVDFSSSHPNLLGVGTYDGSVCVFDVATKTNKPVLENFESPGKHTGPVWEIIWVERERITGDDKGEILVSVSADGRVCQWSIKKGFEHLEVMKLKRVLQSKAPNKSSGTVTESLVNRFSSGMGLAFKVSDSNVYIAGTEDGHIHRCSCSYNEQFLATYHGHKGPVYRVQWSPFLGDVFMSASADWSMKIWHQDINEPLLSFQPSLKAVTDINWSPFSATIFGCSTEDAIQIFDLSVSTIDPVVTHPVEGRKLTAFAFSRNSPCVIFGDNKGEVSVMKTFNVFSEVQEMAAVSSVNEESEVVERQEGKLQDLVEAAVEQVNKKEQKRGKTGAH